MSWTGSGIESTNLRLTATTEATPKAERTPASANPPSSRRSRHGGRERADSDGREHSKEPHHFRWSHTGGEFQRAGLGSFSRAPSQERPAVHSSADPAHRRQPPQT